MAGDLVTWLNVMRGGDLSRLIPIYRLQHSPQSGAILFSTPPPLPCPSRLHWLPEESWPQKPE